MRSGHTLVFTLIVLGMFFNPAQAVVLDFGFPIDESQVVGSDEGETLRVSWIVQDLAPHEQREYQLRRREGEVRGTEGRGVQIDRRALDEGRLAMTVGGKPFTTYHFGPDLPRIRTPPDQPMQVERPGMYVR